MTISFPPYEDTFIPAALIQAASAMLSAMRRAWSQVSRWSARFRKKT